MGKTVKIAKDAPLATIKRHKKRLMAAFEKANDFNSLKPADQFLLLGHIKILCAFCAEAMIVERARMMLKE